MSFRIAFMVALFASGAASAQSTTATPSLLQNGANQPLVANGSGQINPANNVPFDGLPPVVLAPVGTTQTSGPFLIAPWAQINNANNINNALTLSPAYTSGSYFNNTAIVTNLFPPGSGTFSGLAQNVAFPVAPNSIVRIQAIVPGSIYVVTPTTGTAGPAGPAGAATTYLNNIIANATTPTQLTSNLNIVTVVPVGGKVILPVTVTNVRVTNQGNNTLTVVPGAGGIIQPNTNPDQPVLIVANGGRADFILLSPNQWSLN